MSADRPLTAVFADREPAEGAQGVLGFVTHGTELDSGLRFDGIPRLSLPVSDSGWQFSETWSAGGAVRSGRVGNLVYAHDGERLFCAAHIPASPTYHESTEAIYRAVFELTGRLRYPRVFRMWNFIGGINDDNSEGTEIYRDFCVGRARAFEELGPDAPVPAATGIGAHGRGIGIYALACRGGLPVHIENPQQVPAYEYPDRYGIKPPKFARATLLDDAGTPRLFVSGTASIIGSETVGHGDVAAQCETTLGNIRLLIGGENLRAHGGTRGYTLRDLKLVKVYVKHAADVARVEALCAGRFGTGTRVVFLNVDVCRSDLLVEIEAYA
ncbi:FkbO/Hyg5 family chorismatase [Streptomyces sp. SID8352]|uniref:FkbO/Hyg5 family chorismatase n=1 Tax=Streptomyces sp. SID8352 TaxID=2690338 RepID=UPI0019291615